MAGQTSDPSNPYAHLGALYLGNVVPMLRALVKADFESQALLHNAKPELAEALRQISNGTSTLVDIAKWVQLQLAGIDWRERPDVAGLLEDAGGFDWQQSHEREAGDRDCHAQCRAGRR